MRTFQNLESALFNLILQTVDESQISMRPDHDLGQIPVSVQKTEEFQQRPLRGQRIGNDRFLLHDFIKFQEHFILDFMEHIVDTVLYFEGDKMLPYRILRAAKNRYGSTNELGMFDMTGTGLAEIENPSQMLLEGRPLGVSGNCVACTMEGSRPILSEIQALATKTNFPAPRRACSGYDYNRMNLLIAVLEKRAGYFFGNLDVYVNIVGGIALRDTACDLAVCLSMVSSLLDRPVSDKLIAIGEVGLGGEVRSVPNLEQRLHEAERIGFERAVIPKHSLAHLNAADYPGMKLVGAAYIADAINALKNDRL